MISKVIDVAGPLAGKTLNGVLLDSYKADCKDNREPLLQKIQQILLNQF